MILFIILISLEIKDIAFASFEQQYDQLYSRCILFILNIICLIYQKKSKKQLCFLVIIHFVQNCIYFGFHQLWYLYPLASNFKHNNQTKFFIFLLYLFTGALDLANPNSLFTQTELNSKLTILLIILFEFYNLLISTKIGHKARQLILDILIEDCVIKIYDSQLNDLTPNLLSKSQNIDNFSSPTIYTTRQSKSNDNFTNNQSQNKQINFKTYKFYDNISLSADSLQSSTQKDQTYNNIKDLIKQYLNDTKISEQLIIANEYDYKTGQKIKYKLIISQSISNYIIVAFIKLDQVYLIKQQNKLIQFKQQLASIFTNKLKTPLNATFGYLNQSINDISVSDQFKQLYLIPAMLNSKLQLYQIQDLLDYLYQDSTQLTLQVAKTNLIKLLLSVNELLELQCKTKQISLQYHINNVDIKYQKSIYINTDSQKLERILINLLNNSYRYSPSNNTIKIDIQIDEQESKAFFRVSDNGEGFTQDQIKFINQQALLQNKFQLVQNHHQDKYHHFKIHIKFGISLQITNHLISALSDQHSSLQLNNSQQGAAFEFFISTKMQNQFLSSQKIIQNSKPIKSTKGLQHIEQDNGSIYSHSSSLIIEPSPQLPLNQKKNELQQFKSRHSHRQSSISLTKRAEENQFHLLKKGTLCESIDFENEQEILIVDDEPFNHDILCLMLKRLGLNKFVKAYNGQQCLDIVMKKKSRIQLIFMDLDMPILGGLQTTEILIDMMQQKKLDYINIIGCTAHDDYDTQLKCINAGMKHVISKPIFLKQVKELFLKLSDELLIKNLFISQSIEKHI
ncbi:unnamed protein product [Paramecium pentaurelia]|uniref:Response regulatory domain-containing protein n=1 Tax=Paramecium pentaurelia TaxID=43138 RepID=A0A8S1TZW8_9CILI|nr:unnamed protein product [Paramecium pentaurelia]